MTFEGLINELEQHSLFGDKISEIIRLMRAIFSNNPPHDMQILDTEDAYFTDHGEGHTERISNNIINMEIIIPSQFSELETFLLMSTAWLHDIGMYIGRREGETVSIVRETHADRSAEIIRGLAERYFPTLTNPELSLIQQIIRSHSSNYDINEISTEPENIDGYIAHIDLLCAIFRLADACDCTHFRAPESIFQIYYDNIPERSKERWEPLFSVTDIIFDEIRSAVVISYDYGNTLRDLIEKYLLSNILKKEIERELESVQGILFEYLIPLSRVLIKYFGKNEYLDLTTFNKENYCLITLNSNFHLIDELVDVFGDYLQHDEELPVYLEIRPPDGPLYIFLENNINVDRVEELNGHLRATLGESFMEIKIHRSLHQEVG